MARHHTYTADHLAAASRTDLLAWLAAERSDLLMQPVDLDERTLSQQAVTGGWTMKDMLAHAAYWDGFFARSIEMALAGQAGEVADLNLDESATRQYALSARHGRWRPCWMIWQPPVPTFWRLSARRPLTHWMSSGS